VQVNAVYLIGLVAARPFPDPEQARCSLLVVTAAPHGTTLERHRVVADRDMAATAVALNVGQSLFVRGTLQRDGMRRTVIVARELWPLSHAPDSSADAPSSGTHAAPREHERIGHWRRVGLNTLRERLVWVRATTVGGAGGTRPAWGEANAAAAPASVAPTAV
jgi:hypothetical protein